MRNSIYSWQIRIKTLLIKKNIHLGGTITSALVVPAMKSGEHQINIDFYNELTAELHTIGGQATIQIFLLLFC